MMKQRYGKIVNLSSVSAVMGNPGQANYAASKGGVIAFTKTVAKEMASRNITVNAVAPGFIKTALTDLMTEKARAAVVNLIPLKRFGQPEDVAQAIVFLVSEEASYITGQILQIDGGLAM
jgi:3-oxoacyl-[acyl-carrier protein] reductase